MSTHRKNGFALPAAIGGLVIAGILVTAGFYMARQEVRIGVASENAALAVSVAQSAINDVLVNETSALVAMSTWDTLEFSDSLADGTAEIRVAKVDERIFFLEATATVTKGGPMWGGASRRVGLVTRINTANIEPPAALTSQGALQWGGSSQLHGIDTAPAGSGGASADWTGMCTGGGSGDKPGLLTNDTSAISWSGNRSKIEDSSSGTPLFDQDENITVESLTQFGDMTWSDMAAMADIVYNGDPGTTEPSYNADGSCNTNVNSNWGEPMDPSSPCFNYFPIIYINSATEVTLNSGYGQGILLVENDIRVNGGYEFYGPVFIKGTLTTNGSGGHFWGGVVAANANLDTNTVLGNAVITYSSCAVSRALLNNSALTKNRPLAMRSWVDLTNVER